MAIQDIFNDMKARVDNARKPYRDAYRAYVETRRKAFGVVSGGARNLARTEIGAARDLFAAARSSFDKARRDGVRRVAGKPQAYLPESRGRIVSAYKESINLLVRTGNELTNVMTNGYRNVVGQLSGNGAARPGSAAQGQKPAARKTASRRSTAARKSAPKRSTSTASKRSSAAGTRSASGTRKTTGQRSGAAKSNGRAGAARARKTGGTQRSTTSSGSKRAGGPQQRKNAAGGRKTASTRKSSSTGKASSTGKSSTGNKRSGGGTSATTTTT